LNVFKKPSITNKEDLIKKKEKMRQRELLEVIDKLGFFK